MQQARQREMPERISWARAMIFGVGFFFIAAMLIGQFPGYIYLQMTSSTLVGFETGTFALGLVCLAGFAVIQVIVLLFDPKPLLPPVIFSGLGVIVGAGGLALTIWAAFSGNEYFPQASTSWAPVLGGKFLWFQPGDIDLTMIGLTLLFVGSAMVFYSVLAIREQRNPERRDLGTTAAIRGMLVAAIILLVAFMVFYTYYNDNGLAWQLFANNPGTGQLIIDTILECVLGLAIFLTLGAFALRLHYLMRPVRKNTMSGLYAIGALGLAQIGVISLIAWFVIYPLVAWMHSWTFIGLGTYLTLCARKAAVPSSCSFTQQAGYIIDGIITTNSFVLLMAATYIWKKNRNLVVIAGVTITAVIGLATLIVHTSPSDILIALLLAGSMLVLATIWTSVARREFAVVGEQNLGCLGMWLVLGTCLFIYIAAFGFFSLPVFTNETEPNVPFISGLTVPAHPALNAPPTLGQADAVVLAVFMGILALIQFYFLIRNRYKV